MKERLKKLVNKLNDILTEETYDFYSHILEESKGGENTNDLIDICLSAHLGSMFKMMRCLADERQRVKEFEEYLLDSISKFTYIRKVEKC